MSLSDDLSADLQAAVADYEQTFEWNGDDYPCVRNTDATRLQLQSAGGFVDALKYTLLVPIAALTSGQPAVGDLVDSGTAQIKAIDPNRAQLLMFVGSVDQ
jgi:hypothetical protein